MLYLMRRMLIRLLILILLAPFSMNQVHCQKKIPLKGVVKDKESRLPLPGANVYLPASGYGVATDSQGHFELTLSRGEHLVVISFIGYKRDSLFVSSDSQEDILVFLTKVPIKAMEVKVIAEKDKNVKSSTTGMIKLNTREIDQLPGMLGEKDPLKIIQLTPGIQSAKQANSGFHVRGGGPDQNLILYDGVTLYNPSHLFGFFSVFNADAIENINFYKAGSPANYGGRLSSVIEIGSKSASTDSIRYKGGIGLLSSRITADGPVSRRHPDHTFLFSARRTYFDILASPFESMSKDNSTFNTISGYYFYDLNFKLNLRLSEKDRITFSGYYGNDNYAHGKKYTDFNTAIKWGNQAGIITWSHIFNDRLSIKNNISHTGYRFDFFARQSEYSFSLKSAIADYHYRAELLFLPDKHRIHAGLDYVYHHFDPNKQKGKAQDDEFEFSNMVNYFSHEASVFINDSYEINDFILVNAGVRYSGFMHTGPYHQLIKDDFGRVVDTLRFATGKKVHNGYNHLEPRVSSRFLLSPASSLKISYNKGFQYVHIVPVSSISLPTDIWIPSTYRVPPQRGQQLALGYYKNFLNDEIETSLEVYAKQMENQAHFANGVVDTYNEELHERLIYGQGNSYGAELFVKKNYGKLTGWLGYTISKTTRRFDELNNGKPFHAKYDRRHDLSVVTSYALNQKWDISGIFVYATGNAMTVPVSRYLVQGNIINEYGEINGFRMPHYHRLDISANYYPDNKNKSWSGHWSFSIYNVYNRQNPYYIYFEAEQNKNDYELEVEPKMVSLFPVMPSVSYNFTF